MKYSFHPEAEAELNSAVEFYEAHEKGLGYEFSLEIYAAVERAAAYPDAWPLFDGDIRRCLVGRFPYGILYAVGADEISVVAVMHLHREPDYWKKRV